MKGNMEFIKSSKENKISEPIKQLEEKINKSEETLDFQFGMEREDMQKKLKNKN